MDGSIYCCTSRASEGRGSSLTLGKGMRAFVLMMLWSLVAVASDVVPPERTAIFSKEMAADFTRSVCITVPDGITGYWSPTQEEVRGIETGLLAYLKLVRPEAAAWFESEDGKRIHRDWPWFRRQAAGVLKDKDRFILVAYRCEDPAETAQQEREARAKAGNRFSPDSWKRRPMTISGGGYGFFRVLYDLKEKRFVWYEENSPE